jgi:hypothetical protein
MYSVPMIDLKATDFAIVVATLMGPVLAVQAQKWVEWATEWRRRRYGIFTTLMVTRGTRLDFDHVRALNSIDIEFNASRLSWSNPRQTRKDNDVITAWRLYAFHLNKPFDAKNDAARIAWLVDGDKLFIDLLMAVAKAVGVKAERERLQGVYHPSGHLEREAAQLKVLNNAAMVLSGEQPLKMAVVDFPCSAEATELQS